MDQARSRGLLREDDDLIVTNGCQQALDLLQRLLVKPGEAVLVEDPIYPGMRSVFARAGVRLLGVPVGSQGVDLEVLARLVRGDDPHPEGASDRGDRLRDTVLQQIHRGRAGLLQQAGTRNGQRIRLL